MGTLSLGLPVALGRMSSVPAHRMLLTVGTQAGSEHEGVGWGCARSGWGASLGPSGGFVFQKPELSSQSKLRVNFPGVGQC